MDEYVLANKLVGVEVFVWVILRGVVVGLLDVGVG